MNGSETRLGARLGRNGYTEPALDLLLRKTTQLDALASYITFDDADLFGRVNDHFRLELLGLVEDLARQVNELAHAAFDDEMAQAQRPSNPPAPAMSAPPDSIAAAAGTRCDSGAGGPWCAAHQPASPTPAQALGMAPFDPAETRRQLVAFLDSGGYDERHPYRVLLGGMAPADQDEARRQLLDFLDWSGYDERHPYRVLLADLPASGAQASAAAVHHAPPVHVEALRGFGREPSSSIRRALVIGLQSFAEVDRLTQVFGGIGALAERLPAELHPIHPTGAADTAGKFAEALRWVEVLEGGAG